MSRWKLGSMVRVNGLFHLLINGVYWGYNPLILTIDPNFQRDIQVHHPESPRKKISAAPAHQVDLKKQ